MKPLVAILAIFALCAVVAADCPTVAHGHVQPVVATFFAPIGVYQQQQAAYSVGLTDNVAAELKITNEKLDRLIEVLAGRNVEIGPAAAEPEHVGLARRHCASCHGISPRGNKLAFFDSTGKFKEPTPQLREVIVGQVASGAMPHNAEMPAADRLKLIAGLQSTSAVAKMPAAAQ